MFAEGLLACDIIAIVAWLSDGQAFPRNSASETSTRCLVGAFSTPQVCVDFVKARKAAGTAGFENKGTGACSACALCCARYRRLGHA
jgi:hypothetical protein